MSYPSSASDCVFFRLPLRARIEWRDTSPALIQLCMIYHTGFPHERPYGMVFVYARSIPVCYNLCAKLWQHVIPGSYHILSCLCVLEIAFGIEIIMIGFGWMYKHHNKRVVVYFRFYNILPSKLRRIVNALNPGNFQERSVTIRTHNTLVCTYPQHILKLSQILVKGSCSTYFTQILRI